MRVPAGLAVVAAAVLAMALVPVRAAPSDQGVDSAAAGSAAATAAFWTAERRAAAVPRDLVIDATGQSYLRGPDGLQPYGHRVTTPAPTVAQLSPAAVAAEPQRKPGGGGDGTPPVISAMDPASGAEVASPYAFKATVTDASGVRSVVFQVTPPGGSARKFNASRIGDEEWSVTLSMTAAAGWTWSVTAKDVSGQVATSPAVTFDVGTGGGGGGSDVVTDARWPATGVSTVETTAGRIYFEMPANSQLTKWNGYVCSGTAVDDDTAGRSVILTAAHCVYDDAHKAFSRNVMFIPDQRATTGAGTDRNCDNDPYGCWVPAFGVVDDDWASRTWPDNIAWDYAFYVVDAATGHRGKGGDASLGLEATVGAQRIAFTDPVTNADAAALGYSYSADPELMYCQQPLAATNGGVNWWLGQCGLSGGASGGPWLQPVSGTAPVISVNSWGYSNQPGMAGPTFVGTSASCVFGVATSALLSSAGEKPEC